jgi:hypothetical protein
MPSGPLMAALAARALEHPEPRPPGSRRFRRLVARVGKLAMRRETETPLAADAGGSPGPPPQLSAPAGNT